MTTSAICERCLATVRMTEVERRRRVGGGTGPYGAGKFVCDDCRKRQARRIAERYPARERAA